MILVVDDMSIIRDPIGACLREAGYDVMCAANGKEALAIAEGQPPELILLDLAMPEMNGLEVLRRLRENPALVRVPVVLLTAVSNKETVLKAAQYRVAGYILKSRFSSKNLLEQVAKIAPRRSTRATSSRVKASETQGAQNSRDTGGARISRNEKPERIAATMPSSASSSPGVAVLEPPTARPANSTQIQSAIKLPPVKTTAKETQAIPILLDRDTCISRAKEAMQTRALSGVVAQVMAVASSPRGDIPQLAALIGRDPSLSARVLGLANSAAYTANGTVATTISDAIRKIGFSAVRNLAAACGIFDALPAGSEGFNPIRCWQHCFAVAQLCETLEQESGGDSSSIAYVIGLCHDLGHILVHMQFGPEIQRVREVQLATGRPLEELERAMLGISQHELAMAVLQSVGLPDSIRIPIETFHRRGTAAPAFNRFAQFLRIADPYANGLLLAANDDAPIGPLSITEMRAVFEKKEPKTPDGHAFRCSILGMTASLARLSRAEEQAMMKPPYPKLPVRIGMLREPCFAGFDPLQAALEALAEVELLDSLPPASRLKDLAGVVVVSRKAPPPSAAAANLLSMQVNACERVPGLLWLVGQIEPGLVAGGPAPMQLPVTLKQLGQFVADAAAVRELPPVTVN